MAMIRTSYSRVIQWCWALLLCPCALAFQARTPPPKSRDAEKIQDVLDRLSGVPVEYRADIEFRILEEWPTVLPWKTQKRMLEDLFSDATLARYSSPVVEAGGGHSTVAHQQKLDLIWHPLDTLDIQARIVSIMRSHYPAESWDMLQQMTLPAHRATCKEGLVETSTPYYTVMASSLRNMPGPRVPNGEVKAAYLAEEATRLNTPAQLRAYAESLAGMNLSAQDFSLVLDQLTARLSLASGSDREMYGAEQGEEQRLTSAIGQLEEKARQVGVNPVPFLSAYRAFLVRNLHTAACADRSLNRQSETAAFNSLDHAAIGDGKAINPLSANEISPDGVGDSAHSEEITSGLAVLPEGHRIALVFAANRKADHASDSPDDYLQPRPEDVDALLRYAVDDSALDQMSPLARFENQNANVEFLITCLPPGPSFQDAVDAELALLNVNPVEQSSPESWLRPFMTLLQISRPISSDRLQQVKGEAVKSGGMIMMPNPQSRMIRDTMRRYQSDRVVSAYLAFEDLFHPAYVTFEESGKSPPL